MSAPLEKHSSHADAVDTQTGTAEDSRKRKLSESPSKKFNSPTSLTKESQPKKLKTSDEPEEKTNQNPDSVEEGTSDGEQVPDPWSNDPKRKAAYYKKESDPNIYVLPHMAKMNEDGPNVFFTWADEIIDTSCFGGFGGSGDGEGRAWFKPHILDIFERQASLPEDDDGETNLREEARYWCLSLSEEARESDDWEKVQGTLPDWWCEFTLTRKRPEEGVISVPISLNASEYGIDQGDTCSYLPKYAGGCRCSILSPAHLLRSSSHLLDFPC